MKQRLHPIELTLMIVAALALTSGAVALHTQSQLAEKVVRLHVLANSDSEEDQALKLKVRDAVLAEASMSYLGIGVKPPDVSLGYMLSESQSYMARAPWYMLTVGGVIVLLILGVSLLGEGLQQKDWGR